MNLFSCIDRAPHSLNPARLHSEDKTDHVDLARRIALETHCAVAVPNYRLSPRNPATESGDRGAVRHPEHAQDVLHALEFLHTHGRGTTNEPLLSAAYNPSKIVLIGHSCGAHILASILVEVSHHELSPSAGLLAAVRGAITTEGIFDIELLLQDFPTYGVWFIDIAFGGRKNYRDVSVTHFRERKCLPWLLVHSRGDDLINLAQSRAMHDWIVESRQSNGEESDVGVETEWERFNDEHDAVLQNPELVKRIALFVTKHTES